LRGVLSVPFQRKKPEPIGVKAPLPGFIEPALASSIGKVPSGDRWIHEIKFDGYRVQVHLANEAVRIDVLKQMMVNASIVGRREAPIREGLF
jgi:hypothetical protein